MEKSAAVGATAPEIENQQRKFNNNISGENQGPEYFGKLPAHTRKIPAELIGSDICQAQAPSSLQLEETAN